MKRIFAVLCAVLLLTACTNAPKEEGVIKVYTRDATSGTREAFFGFIGLGEDLTSEAIEAASNGDMATKIGADSYGIGYVSLDTDFTANKIVALDYEGVKATKENVLNKSYALSRPFMFATRASGTYGSSDKEELVAAFCDFMMNSVEGGLAISGAGAIVTNDDQRVAWSTLADKYPVIKKDNSGITIVTVGSTSVEKSLKALLETFQPMAGNFQFQMNQTGSGDAQKRILGDEKNGPNQGDIGFASRAFRAEEDISKAMAHGEFALDAVVVAVSKDNTSGINNLSKEQAYAVFAGEVVKFSELK